MENQKDKDVGRKKVPVVFLPKTVIFPFTEALLSVDLAFFESTLIKMPENFAILLLAKESVDEKGDLIGQIGTLGTVNKVYKDQRMINIFVSGTDRAKIVEVDKKESTIEASIEKMPLLLESNDFVFAIIKHLKSEIRRAINLGKEVDFMRLMNILGDIPPVEFAYKFAAVLDINFRQRMELLEIDNLRDLLFKLDDFIAHEIQVLEIERTIDKKTQEKISKSARDAVLRERLLTIEKELGYRRGDEGLESLENKITSANMPEAVSEKALSEAKRLKEMPPFNPEYSYIRTYLDWLISLPWSKKSPEKVDLKEAKKVLDQDHYSLEKIKERVIDYLAIVKLREQNKKETFANVNILNFTGPPGVGKTSIGQSIARALNRKFVSFSLGGMRDEAEIRGHRRTYVGALPGKIIQGIKKAGTKNPVIMMDEIDKVGSGIMGDPAAALLEVLDPTQNKNFTDNYLEVPFDLSEVFFITTSNLLDPIPLALKDRMEVIDFNGYTEDEKLNIAQKFLIPKLIKNYALADYSIDFDEDAIRQVIEKYTREAGVRQLERELGTILRKVAREIIEKNVSHLKIKKADIVKFLGPEKVEPEDVDENAEPGIAPALAWTESGGQILYIEVAVMPGKGGLILTGHLGEVMKESCQAALSYIRSRYELFELEEDFYKKIDVHVHVPRGAVAKDGPSAGVAITSAIISALIKKPLKKKISMTGEITLRGKILAVGGIKEKIIASHRADYKKIILPYYNQKDLIEIPKEILTNLKIYPVSEMDQVIKLLFS